MANEVKVSFHGITDNGVCSLSGKDGTECVSVSFDDGTIREGLLSFKALQSLLRMKLSKKSAAPKAMPTPPVMPSAVPPAPAIPTANLAAPK